MMPPYRDYGDGSDGSDRSDDGEYVGSSTDGTKEFWSCIALSIPLLIWAVVLERVLTGGWFY